MQILKPGPLNRNLHFNRISGPRRSIKVWEPVVSGTLLLEVSLPQKGRAAHPAAVATTLSTLETALSQKEEPKFRIKVNKL